MYIFELISIQDAEIIHLQAEFGRFQQQPKYLNYIISWRAILEFQQELMGWVSL